MMGKIAIVGQGYMARTHAAAWAELGRQDDIAYVCTPRPRPPLQGAPRAEFVTKLDDALSDPELEIVSVCSPTATHRELTERALAAGMHVLLEKPIALSEEDARAIEDAGSRADGILMVAHVLRFFAGYRELRRDFESGGLGEVVSVRARRLASAAEFSPWLDDENQSGGILIDVCIHDFDFLNFLMGEPIAVTTTRPVPKGPAEVTIEYRGGGIGQVLSTYGLPASVPFTASIEAMGTRGMAEAQFSASAPTGGGDAGEDSLHRNDYRVAMESGSRSEQFTDDRPYTEQARHFLECLQQSTPSALVPTSAAVEALVVGRAARRSLAEGRRVVIAR